VVRALGAVDLATGFAFGAPRRVPRLPAEERTPVAALEAAVLPALRRGPCLVSFSGGRDSSAVLAVATRVARREGLPDPIPATNRVPRAEQADEAAWQETVVAHLGLPDWLRLEWDDELDAVGPVAREVIRRHGLLWPFNAFFHQPLLACAAGGSLLTGVGGDELFMAAVRPRPATARGRALAHAPYALRRAVLRRRHPLRLPWLTHRGVAAATASAAAHEAGEPLMPVRRLAWARAQRYLALGTASLRRLADAEGTAIVHPLLDTGLWAATAACGGFESRTDGTRRLVGEALPPAVIEREDKACFDEVFCGRHSRVVAAAYGDACGGLVDPEALRTHWQTPEPLPQSLFLLQAAVLAQTGRAASSHAPVLLQNVERLSNRREGMTT
jgi:asparagine synthetase B (glutamine-hydrolysing)